VKKERGVLEHTVSFLPLSSRLRRRKKSFALRNLLHYQAVNLIRSPLKKEGGRSPYSISSFSTAGEDEEKGKEREEGRTRLLRQVESYSTSSYSYLAQPREEERKGRRGGARHRSSRKYSLKSHTFFD